MSSTPLQTDKEKAQFAMIRRTFVLAIALAAALAAAPAEIVRAGAAPALDRIGPSTVSVGDPDFTIRLTGENFDRGSVVVLDATPLETTFISKQRLHARIPMSATAATGTHAITVRTGDGATTGAKTLTVGTKSPSITIDRVNPDTLPVVLNGFSVIVRIAGEGFTDESTVLVYGREIDTAFFAKGLLQVIVPNEFVSNPGLMPIQVRNQGGALSNILTQPVFDRAAIVATIDPASVKAGSAAFTLKISGNAFSEEAVVRVGNVELTPTEIKPGEIKVQIPAAVVAQEAQLPLVVSQSTGLSNTIILRVTPADGRPLIYDVNPAEVQAGAGEVRVRITGANFSEKSKILVNGNEVRTTFVGRATLTFKLTEALTSSPNVTLTVQVRNEDGVVTNIEPIEIVEAAVVDTLSGEKLDGFVDGGPDEARFRRPSRMAFGPDGLLYVADQLNNAIRRLNPATGFVETLAGDGKPGYVDTGDSTVSGFTTPRFNNPLGIAVAQDGTIYVSDFGNRVIRRLQPTGSGYTVDTVAGANALIEDKDTREETYSTRRGLVGFQNGTGDVARFRGPDGMALASDGTLYVVDATNHYVRAIDTTSSTFDVTTTAGIGITGFTDGDISVARFTTPTDVAISPDESFLVVADFNNNRVRRITLATGQVSTVAGSGFEGTDSGTPLIASFQGPIGVAIDADGTIYVADHFSDTIRRISPEGITTTLAGGSTKKRAFDGIGPKSRFKDPRGIVFDPETGDVLVSDQGHQRVRRIQP
jgi:sugar lactone lactonase YvrE